MLDEPDDRIASVARGHLRWLLEMGADEIIAEAPVDRLKPKPQAPLPQSPAASRLDLRPSPPRAASPDQAIGNARAVAAACTSLADIAAVLRQFDACPLK